MKYLLSTGNSTNKVELYIIDLFKLYLQIYPKDIPNSKDIGFDFIFNDVKKDEVVSVIRQSVSRLANKIKNKFNNKYSIVIDSIEIIDEEKVKLTITVNEIESEEISIDFTQK